MARQRKWSRGSTGRCILRAKVLLKAQSRLSLPRWSLDWARLLNVPLTVRWGWQRVLRGSTLTSLTEPKFSLGQLVATRNAANCLSTSDVSEALRRHASGDWGDLTDDDRAENELSLIEGFRLLSSYVSSTGVKFWIITEADRSSTTVLLPEDY